MDLSGNFTTSVFRYRPYHGTLLYERLLERGYNLGQIRRDSHLVGMDQRQQFNFQSENFAACSEETIINFIKLTDALKNE